jgi:hypothetical protein
MAGQPERADPPAFSLAPRAGFAQEFVIPGRRAAANPESIFQRLVFMDSGFAPFGRAPE